jgi:acetyl esterase/lipase
MCRAILRSHAEQFEIDADHIGVWGESCGGQLAGLMAVMNGIPDFEDVGGWEGVSSAVQGFCGVVWWDLIFSSLQAC